MSVDAIVESPCSDRRQSTRSPAGGRVDFQARARLADRLDVAVGWRPDHRPRTDGDAHRLGHGCDAACQSHFFVLKMTYRTIAMATMITTEAMKPDVSAKPG